ADLPTRRASGSFSRDLHAGHGTAIAGISVTPNQMNSHGPQSTEEAHGKKQFFPESRATNANPKLWPITRDLH
ncbi:MAG: hypothetical protein ACK5DM_13270, partial [Planctomyces sp.]